MNTINLGSRARIGTLIKKLEDATTGNRDGIVGNEDLPANQIGKNKPSSTNPVLFGVGRSLGVGLTKRNDEAILAAYLNSAEARWGQSVSELPRPPHVSETDWNAFRVDKAIVLARFGRHPKDIQEMIVPARGTVAGEAIAPRDLFVQRYAPTGTPTGNTVVVAPGFLETGRNYVEQAMFLSGRGDEVLVLDQQWAGLSQGEPGGIDRGFGITRDVAAVTAKAAQMSPGNRIIIAGTSMGGGAGAYGAAHMGAQGKIELEGPAMPKEVGLVLQDPFFSRTGGLINSTLAGLGKVPFFKDVPVPAFGLPVLSRDQATLRKIASHANVEGIKGRPSAFNASTEDLAAMKKELEAGLRPPGKIYVIHADRDPLASYEETSAWVKLLGDRAKLQTLHSNSHVIEENPTEQREILSGIAWVTATTG